MTTIVINNGNVFTDTKSTIVDPNAGSVAKQFILDNINSKDPDTIFAIESFINSRWVNEDYNISFDDGKYLPLSEEDMIIPGEKVKGITFAGFASYPVYAEYFLKGNQRSIDELVDKFTNIDRLQYEASTAFYKDNYAICSSIAELTYAVFAIITDKGTHLVTRKELLNPESGYISLFYPRDITITLGSGASHLYGLVEHVELLLNNNYTEHYTNPNIKSTSDAVDFIKRASLVDIMTNDDVRVF